MRLRGGRFFQYSKICLHFQVFVYNISNKLLPLKHILALPTWGQICTISELQPITLVILQLEHLVIIGQTLFHRTPNTKILLEHSVFIGPAFIIPRLHFNNRNRFPTETVPYFVIFFSKLYNSFSGCFAISARTIWRPRKFSLQAWLGSCQKDPIKFTLSKREWEGLSFTNSDKCVGLLMKNLTNFANLNPQKCGGTWKFEK